MHIRVTKPTNGRSLQLPLPPQPSPRPLNRTSFNIALTTILVICSFLPLGESMLDFIRPYNSFANTAARPKFNVLPADQTVDQGARVQLTCSGEANPPPLMFWYKEGHRQLMFPSSSSANNANQKISHQQQPAPWPQAAALTTNSDISPATNKLFSMPIANMDHLAAQQNYFANRIYVDSQGTLNINNATSSDNGYYACALISSVGSVMAKAKLTVKPSPNQPLNAASSTHDFYSDPIQQARLGAFGTGVTGKFDLLPPPVIKMGSANQTLPTNTSTVLLCDVVSQVAYKIQWFIDNQVLQEDPPRITVLENGNLGINNLRVTDSGVYTCVVTAANDQNMPVASPYEPLDSSMLTSAPPIQQSVAHSCFLKVASPTQFSIPLYRMDLYAYPSAPGMPYMISNHGEDAITIAWSPPPDSGALPIKHYVVEHYDTSHEHLGWLVIHRVIGKETILLHGLSAEGSHFFVVRAANGHGVGPSSAIAGPMRTLAGENRYSLENQRRRNPTGLEFADTRPDTNQARERLMTVSTNLISLTPVGSNSIRLQWATYNNNNSSLTSLGDFLEGYSIRYRAIGAGETLLGKEPLFGMEFNQFETISPSSLPLVTSYVDDEETIAITPRMKRDLTSYYDYSQEFNEVRITDHNVESYTINGLRPFTTYQFFVVPYFKDIDGIPSNILTAQTNEDRPSVAPPVPSIRPINNTAIRAIWPHTPPHYANGIIRGYLLRINSSDMIDNSATSGQPQIMASPPRILTLPMTSLLIAPLANPASIGPRHMMSSMQQYIVMYDIANLTYRSFYSIQVAGLTSVGPGPWSEAKNFIMDPRKIAEQIKSAGSEIDDLMTQSFLSTIPNSLDEYSSQRQGFSSIYIILPVIMIIISIILIAGYILYRRNDQQVITWKKTISEHLSNKFYMPAVADPHHRGHGSIQQNIYDHQHHLIYSAGSTHMPQQSIAGQGMWPAGSNNGTACINSSGTGSLSSHGGLLPISTEPNSMRTLNTKDNTNRFVRGNNPNGTLFCQQDPTRAINSNMVGHQQIIHHGGDYYSVINNVAEYEEVDPQQRNNMQQISSGNALDRHQTGSSNSDTSCPSSVTRLLPNQNYNRELLARNAIENQHHEMILQQQVAYNGEVKQPFITMINPNDPSKYHQQQQKSALSPYATTNLMNQLSNQQSHQAHIFNNPQVAMMNQQSYRQQQHQGYIMPNNGSTMDDSSKIFMTHLINSNGGPNPANAFRTLQRSHNSIKPAIAHSQPTQIQQVFMQTENGVAQFANNHGNYGVTQQTINHNVRNPMSNGATGQGSLIDGKSNLYEPIDYNINSNVMVQTGTQMSVEQANTNSNHEILSSSTSNGSMVSPPEQGNKLRRGEINGGDTEEHDLRVFAANPHASRTSDSSVRQTSNGTDDASHDADKEEDLTQVDEATPFRRQSAPGEEHRARQLSKRERKQQRSRLHNMNQQPS